MPDLTPESLRAWREANGLTRRAAAELLGLSERSVENLEYGWSPQSPLWGVLEKLVPLVRVPKATASDGTTRSARASGIRGGDDTCPTAPAR
jgi:transcriptional regulator with XRE-family HTH domain